MLFITANCSLEWNCQQLLAEKNTVNILLPFCKSEYFGIRLGAKSSLSSISCFVAKQNWRFLQINKHEQDAILESLKQFAESGNYRRQFVTSLCKYYFSALDLLLLLNALVNNPLNSDIIQSSNLYSVLPHFLTSGTEMEKDCIIELLWRLRQNQKVHLHLFKRLLPNHISEQLPEEVFGRREALLFSPAATSALVDTNVQHHSNTLLQKGNSLFL